MHEHLILERPAVSARADRSDPLPRLLDKTTRSLHEQFATDFVWTYLRLPGEPSIPLASAGREARVSETSIVWIGNEPRLAPDLRREVVAMGAVCYQEAMIDFVLGRAGRPLSPAEGSRFARVRATAQKALDRASIQQCEQALRFQQSLLRRRDADCRRLQGELASRDRMLRELNHDLVNDLTPVAFATEDLEECLDIPEAMLRHIVLIERQCVRMRQRLRQGLSELNVPARAEPPRLDLRAVVVELVDAWRPAFERRQQRFSLTVPTHALWVQARELDLNAIASNLLSNANKYTPEGGHVELCLDLQDDMVLLEITDSGVGMSPVVLRRLFEPGVREHLGVEGSGVGLHQVSEVVRRLQGTIEAESRPQRGTTFRVRLPHAL